MSFNETCPICLNHVNHQVILNCNHMFCKGCILFDKNRKCPLCRQLYKLKVTLRDDYKKK